MSAISLLVRARDTLRHGYPKEQAALADDIERFLALDAVVQEWDERGDGKVLASVEERARKSLK